MILQFSTGGRSGAGKERGGMLALKPDMASLATGSCNFPTRVYENSPDLIDWLAAEMLAHDVKPEIEAFDLSMIFKAVEMARAGKIKAPLHVQFVMGVKNAMPVDREVFEFYVATLKRLAPDATWTGAGIGKDQLTLNRWSLELGGHCRTGLEDNVRWDKDRAGAVQRRAGRRAWPSCAPSTAGGRRPWPRRARCCTCGRRREVTDERRRASSGRCWAMPRSRRSWAIEARARAMVAVEIALAKVEGRLGVIDAAAAAAIEAALVGFAPDLDDLTRGTAAAGVPVPALVAQLRRQVGGEAATLRPLGRHLAGHPRHRAGPAAARGAGACWSGGSTRRSRPWPGSRTSIAPRRSSAGRASSRPCRPRSGSRSRAGWRRCCAIASGWASCSRACSWSSSAVPPAIWSRSASVGSRSWRRWRPSWASAARPCPGTASATAWPSSPRWLALVTGSLGKLGQDVLLLAQNEVGEVREAEGGGSSTMPQKSNPIRAEALVTLARRNATLVGGMHEAALHAHERDGAAWQLEWGILPDMVSGTAAALAHADALARTMVVDTARMAAVLAATRGPAAGRGRELRAGSTPAARGGAAAGQGGLCGGAGPRARSAGDPGRADADAADRLGGGAPPGPASRLRGRADRSRPGRSRTGNSNGALKAPLLRGPRSSEVGGADRDRTDDLLNAIQALSQLSYGPSR